MRSTCLLAFFVAASMSSASFDLVLVADNTGNFSGPVPSKIHRYDGDSGTYLGSFNAGFSTILDMAVNPGAGELYSLSSGNLQVFDYNRGTVLRQFSLSGTQRAIKFQNNKLYRTSGTSLLEIDVNTGGSTTVRTWTQSISDFVVAADGSIAFYNATSGNVQGFSPGGVAGAMATITGLTSGKVSGDGFQSNRFYVMGSAGTTTATSFASYNQDLLGNLTATGGGAFSGSFLNSFVDLTKSHNGVWIYAKNQAGNNAMYRMYTGLNTGDTFFTTPQVTTSGPIAVVLAPEPGTMIALGAGALALLRRRRRA